MLAPQLKSKSAFRPAALPAFQRTLATEYAASGHRSLQVVEGLLEGGDEVLGVLEAARDADEAVGDADLGAVLREHVGVRHHGRARDDGLGRAEVLAQAPRLLDGVHELAARLRAALDLEPQHAAVEAAAVLLVSERLLRVRLEARVADGVDLRVGLQELGDRLGVVRLLADAEREGLGGLQLVESDLRRHGAAEDVLVEADLLVPLLSGRDDGAADGDVVAVVVLGRGLQDQVDAVVDRAADDGRGEGRVGHVHEALLLGERRERRQVGEHERRVGRGLGEDHLGVGLDGGLDLVQVGHVDEGELHVEAGEHDAHRAVRAAVRAVGDDGVVAGRHDGGDDGAAGGHTGSEGGAAGAVLRGGDLLLERGNGRVGRAGVREALLAVLGDRLLDEGRGLVHRGEDGAGHRVREDAGVHHTGVHAVLGLGPVAGAGGGRRAEVLGHRVGGHDCGDHTG
mmetsp:Transcript_31002/g.95760  ORF Transcript_31002/g.95760 Transcript_31002/m.95760 type:complete len:455 (-) Transcript_31002:40-1404(-)